jgi:hypothetical protein
MQDPPLSAGFCCLWLWLSVPLSNGAERPAQHHAATTSACFGKVVPLRVVEPVNIFMGFGDKR